MPVAQAQPSMTKRQVGGAPKAGSIAAQARETAKGSVFEP